ncbi:MFS transporter [Streptomyces sp. NPDC048295]|uniref:MFS transporter n=1 Tax=Streptomyces sp. NPDC048295 TaxID=3154617 RepID=UPI003430FF54
MADGPATAAGPQRPPEPLRRNRDYLLLWLGAGVSALGDRTANVAYPLLMVWYGGSPTDAGFVGFAGLLPMLLVQLPAGVVVDRLDRRRTMIVCDVVALLAMTSVAVAVFSDRLWLIHMMAAAFVGGTASIFYRLSERAAVRNVVHPDHLSPALSGNEARTRAAGLLGQPLGSSLYGVARWSPFVFAAVSHVAALVSLLSIRREFQTERRRSPLRLRAEMAEGIRWLLGQRFLRAAISLVAVTNILFQALTLALILIVKENGGSPAAIGVIGLVSGLGGIAGALSGSQFVRRLRPGPVIIAIFGVWTVLMPLVALAQEVYLLAALFAGSSFAGAVLNVLAGVYQVRMTPDEMQGRVGGVSGLLSSGASSLGSLAGGFALSSVGTTRTVLGVGAVMLATFVASALIPAVRCARRADEADVPAEEPEGGTAERAGSSSDSER